MSWIEEALGTLYADAGKSKKPKSKAIAELKKRLEQELTRVITLDEARDLLAAGSLLLQTSVLQGNAVFTDWTNALRDMTEAHTPGSTVAVVCLGDAGHALLNILSVDGGRFRRFFLDLETTRIRALDPEVVQVVLEGSPEGTRYSDLLRSAYRAVAGPTGLPPQLAEALGETRVTVHVVVSIEDPWVALVPELLFDLRSFLDWGNRGRCVVHLLSRPLPRVRGSFREALLEIERARTFDDAFIVCGAEQQLAEKVARFLRLSTRVPELLIRRSDARQRGHMSSYGTARVHLVEGETAEQSLSRLDSVFRTAAPSWVPVNVVLSEVAPEQVYYIYPPSSPLPEIAWKFCPEMVPLPLDDVEPTLCRIQRGLRLEDLRLI